MRRLHFNSYVIAVKKEHLAFHYRYLMTGLPYPTGMSEMLIIKDH